MAKREKIPRRKKKKTRGARPSDEAALREEAEKRGLRLLTYEIHYKPMDMDSIPEEAQSLLEELYFFTRESPEEAIGRLREAIVRFPRVPQFYNYLGAALGATKQLAEQEALAKESFEKFPDYLFAWVNYGQVLVRHGKLSELDALFPKGIDPRLMYPERKAFHVTEVNAVYMLAATYHLKKGEIDVAENLLEIMMKVDPDSAEVEVVEDNLEMAVFRRNMESFFVRRRR